VCLSRSAKHKLTPHIKETVNLMCKNKCKGKCSFEQLQVKRLMKRYDLVGLAAMAEDTLGPSDVKLLKEVMARLLVK